MIVIILIIDNWQPVSFNLFDLYHPAPPLIILIFIFFLLGAITGYLIAMFNKIPTALKINKLEKEIDKLKETNHANT